jgi:glycosyltransferase involved in cell wall biosynthesis
MPQALAHAQARPGESRLHLDSTRPLRVVVVTSSYNFIKDGVALTLNRLVEYLERQGVEVLVVAPVADVPAFEHCGTVIPVPSVPLPVRSEYRLALGLPPDVQQRMAAFQPDIVHIAVPDILGYRALQVARRLKIPVVASYHTRYETYLRHYWYVSGLTPFVAWHLRRFYAACREVYVPSASMADALLASGHRNNIRLWPRGVDAARFHPDKRSMAWRARHGIGPEEVVVLQVSRLVREKRIDTLSDTMRGLRNAGVAHKCLIVGDGPDRHALEKLLPDAVFTGFLDGEDLDRAYASSDVFVFPSDTESFGNVTLEAMASGLPCVCADATGSRSLVIDGSTGFLAGIGRADEFAGHIARLATMPELRRRMGAAARARSLEFAWDETLARMLGYYRSLLAESDETLRAAA